ncbi:RICIN domain-containing protein [Pseudosporangium ferrugineum]|uniref:Ricin-type beta-trefoil lectin protein n=1 Tax=Pseudosporangium ferrugineum TaxID=439699 RepID=A0A2T0RJD1_9ACTN|nr:ricin-type beta-trefoil lectin domain protein [Pseudosporangium ferrugineum]PRY21295.1 ricin-type beta-trefoil lectin protein [Pseudosporangium ferrugineum]
MGKLRSRCAVVLATVVAGSGMALALDAPAVAAAPAPDPVAIGQAEDGDLQVLATDADTAGAQVKVRAYKSGLPAAVKAQRWTFEVVAAGNPPTYRIKHLSSGLCLQEAAAKDGANVVLAACGTGTNQRWTNGTAQSWSPAGFDLRNKADGRCLDLYASADGQPATMWTCASYYTTQFWRVRTGGFDCGFRSETGFCVTNQPPVHGVMLNFRQQPVSFTGPPSDPEWGSGYNEMSNQVNWDPLDASNGNPGYDYAEMGWRGAYDADTGSTAHGAYWLEVGVETEQSTQEFHAIVRPDSTLADGSMHTWMSLGNDAGEWDVFYDFNLVGTTRFAAGNRTGDLEHGLFTQYAEYASLATPFENRLQLLDGNDVWHRPSLGQVSGFPANICGLPDPFSLELGEANTPPYCFTSSVTPRSTGEVDRVTLGKPASGTTATAAPAPRTVGKAFHNGVDQRALAACLGDDPARCLKTVPGLARCVAAREQCNALSARAHPSAQRRTPIVSAEARRLADADLHGKAGSSRVTTMTVSAAGRKGVALEGTSASTKVHVVTGDARVDGLGKKSDRTYQGYTMAYDAADGRLLYACLGSACPRKELA